MVRVNYYLECDQEQVGLYKDYVLCRIYGVLLSDCTVSQISQLRVRIDFSADNIIPLVNTLPRTEIVGIYTDPLTEKENVIKDVVSTAFLEGLRPQYHFHAEPRIISVLPCELSVAVAKLAREGVYDIFACLNQLTYIVAKNTTYEVLVLTIEEGHLEVKILNTVNTYLFDMDEGYSSIVAPLNQGWMEWKKKDDVRLELHPPNRV